MTQDTTRKTLTMPGAEPQDLEKQIRRRAYELYETCGREDGHDFDDWLRAEEEITRQKTRIVAA